MSGLNRLLFQVGRLLVLPRVLMGVTAFSGTSATTA
jgi:hypothetical protein